MSTILEDCNLPSKGMLYNKPFDSHLRIRSMTVADEMKRLSPTDHPYKLMSDIIDNCLEDKLPFSSYDLCLADYTYLLHRLRVATYGPEYKILFTCPNCGEKKEMTINLDELKVNEYTSDIKDQFVITLPKGGNKIKLRLQTPRDLDRISIKAAEMKKQFPEMDSDPTLLLTLESLIESIDDHPVDPVFIGEQLKNLPMMDMNYLVKKATKLNEKVGIDTVVEMTCDKCSYSAKSTFLYTDEFFRPEVD